MNTTSLNVTLLDTVNTAAGNALPLVPAAKRVPSLYEQDARKYAGPHRWQVQGWARLVRRWWRPLAYTRWLDRACTTLQVQGGEHLQGLSGPCVFIANHSSHLDTLVIDAVLPQAVRERLFFGAAQDRWFVKGKKKLETRPWYQSLALGNFPILRGGGARALAYASWLLKREKHVFLFPEGTRATGAALGKFKHGATLLALEHGVPIVPIYLAGLRQLRPKGSQHVKQGAVAVQILPPVTFAKGIGVAEATAQLQQQMEAVHAQYCTA